MQTTVSMDRAIGRAGLIADNRQPLTRSRLAAGDVKAGVGVFRVPVWGQPTTSVADPGSVWQNASPDGAVDVDAILAASGASAASIQTLTAANWDGAVGAYTAFYPPRKITFTLSNHADWDVGTIAVTFKNQYGVTVTESLAVANAGNATLTTTALASAPPTSVVISAMSGTGGTFTIGLAVLDATVDAADFQGVAVYDESLSPNTVPSQSQTAEYHDRDVVSVLRKGAIWVTTEDACSFGAPVYVRVIASGANTQIGAFRSDADSSNAVLVPNAEFGKDSAAAGLNILEIL